MGDLKRRIVRFPLRRRRLAEALFGIRLPALGPRDYYFDLVSIALLQVARRAVGQGERVLDMGCGAHALLGLALEAKRGARVVACDVNPQLVTLARESVARNGSEIEVRSSRFFDELAASCFDFVLFNPPYVPREAARRMGLPEDDRRSQWDGGTDGREVLRSFLHEFAEHDVAPLALIGCNRWWITQRQVSELVGELPDLDLERSSRSRWWPGEVHWVRRLSRRGE